MSSIPQWTSISERRLVELRASNAGRREQFVDPHTVHRLKTVVSNRGLGWVQSVLGRPITEMSTLDPFYPKVNTPEMYTLLDADVEESRAVTDAMNW